MDMQCHNSLRGETLSKKSPAPAKLPLKGRRVLVTRARKQAEGLSNLLRAQGAEVIEVPAIEIRHPASFGALDEALKKVLDYDWLILTSVNGVEALFNRLTALAMDESSLQHLKIAAIGPATEQAIADRGLVVDVVPDRYIAEEVVRALWPHVQRQRVLLVRAKIARDVIPTQLATAGAKVDVIEAYETVIPEHSKHELENVFADEKRRPEIITFTSSSTVRNFLSLIMGTDIPKKLPGVKFASIGPVTSETLREYALPVHIEAEDYTMEGLVEAISKS
jgi:uroporphyrinogen-III synthase